MLNIRALSAGHASSGVMPGKPIVFPRLLNAAAEAVGLTAKRNRLAVEFDGGPNIDSEPRLLGPKNSRFGSAEAPTEEFVMTGVSPKEATAFS